LSISATSLKERAIENLHSTDSVYIPLEQWKYIQSWAEYGFACEKEVKLLKEQIAKDAARTEKMQDELNSERKKNKRSKNGIKVIGAVALAEMIVIILLIFLP